MSEASSTPRTQRLCRKKTQVMRALGVAVCVFALASACWAEKGVLVVLVQDTRGRPVAGIEIAAQGSGISDRLGRVRIHLDPTAAPGDKITLRIGKSPAKPWKILSPWDGDTQIPLFEKEDSNFVKVVVTTFGDLRLLRDPKALTVLIAGLLSANSLKSTEQDTGQEHQEAVQKVARTFGLSPDDLDQAIRALGTKSRDPYKKGLVELYESNYPLATRSLEKSLEMREKKLGHDQAETADAAFFLGLAKYGDGKYREAAAAFQKVLSLRSWDATAMSNLGVSLLQAGDYVAAEPIIRRALAIVEAILGPDDPDVASALINLAELVEARRDLAEAEPLIRRALKIDETALGRDSAMVARDLNSLAGLLMAKSDYVGAEPLLRQALTIDEKARGPNHPEVATLLNNLAGLLREKGDTGAEPLFRRALAIDEKALGPNHVNVGRDLNNLAGLLRTKHDYVAAEASYRRALDIEEKARGPDHPAVATVLNNLAELLCVKHGYAGAEPLLRRALSIDEKALGPEHPTVAARLTNLAGLLIAEGDVTEAEPLLRRALAIDEKASGFENPEVAGDLNNLAVLLEDKGDYTEAEALWQRALAICEKVLGPDHPHTRLVRESLAALVEKRKGKAGGPQ